MATGGDPVQCACRTNACTRVKGRQGDNTRGYCECRENGTSCTYLCRCGQGRHPCVNRQCIEEEEYSDEDPLSQCNEQECDEVLSVYYGEDEVTVSASDTLNTSLQDLATEQAELNDSLMVNDDEQSPVRQQSKSRNEKGVKVQAKCKKNSAKLQKNTATEDELTSKITKLSEDGLQQLILKMAQLYPDLVAMAMDPDPPGPPPGTQKPSWCKCGNCRDMPTTTEELCCIKSEKYECILVSEAGPINQLVLSRRALEVAILNHNEYCIQNDDPSNNDALRHMAYRKFVLWRRGYLGAGHRVVIPSCVVWAIRNKYPSADGTYTGFKFSLMY